MIPILYPVNGLAPPSVTITNGAAAGFPVRRLYDGDIGLFWKDSGTGNRDILIDCGVARAFDTAIFGAGHNLSGVSVQWFSGPTTGSFTLRMTFTVGDVMPHRQTLLAPVTDRWWLFRFTGTTVAPQVPEVVLSLGVPFPSSPVLRGQEIGQLSRVIDLEGAGGAEWNLVRGPVRWTASYPLVAMTAADRDTLLAAHRALDGGARACYLTDGEGVTRWVNWADRHVRLSSTLPDRYDGTLAFREVLGAP